MVLVWLLVSVGVGVPVGAQSSEGFPVPSEPPLGVGGGLVAGQVDGVLGGGEDGFAEVEAEPGSPPLDGPLDEDLGRLDESGMPGPVSGQDGEPGPVADVFGGGFLEAPVEVEAVEGPAPEGFGGLAMCAGRSVCGSAQILPGPTGLSCSVTASVIVFSWNAVTGADNYTAKLQLASGVGGQTVRTTSGTTAVYAGLSSSTRYYIGVHSNVGGVAQYYSGVYCTTAVGPPVCGAVSASGVQLYWRADSRVHQWYVGRATVGNQYVDGRALAGSVLSTVFTGLAANVDYTFFFWWRASPTGVWNQVHPSTVCTTAAPPAAPVVSCTATASTITASWESVRGASRYRVSRGSGWASASGLSHVFSNLAESTAYSVRVQGWNSAGWGQTGTASCTTPASVLPAPTGLECEASPTQIRFSWDAVVGADGYSAKIQLAVPNSAQTQMRTTSTTVVFGGLAASTRYWVSVLAVKGGKAQHFAGVYCTTLADIAAPALSCTATSNSVSASWPKVTGATKYRARIGGGAWTDDIEPAPDAASVVRVFAGLAAGTMHTVTVQSGGEKGWGQAATVRCVTSAAGVDCDQTTSDSVVLQWAPIDEAQYWYAAIWTGSSWANYRTVYEENTTEFTGLAKGTAYEIHLWWYGKDEKWHKVNPASRCYTKHLDTPVLAGYTTGGNTLTIQWQPVDGAEIYLARVSPAGSSGASGASGGGEWEIVVSAGNSHTFTDLKPGMQYTVQLRAGTIAKAKEASDNGVEYKPESGDATDDHTTSTVECKAHTTSTIDIEWDDPNGDYQWRIARTLIDQNGNFQYLGTKTFAKGTTGATLTGLQPNTIHWITVWKSADSGQRWQVLGHVPHCQTAPADLEFSQCPQTADTDGTVRWTPNGAAYYRIARDRKHTDPEWIATNATSHTFTGLAEETTYEVAVQAWTPMGWTTSATCDIKTLPKIPDGFISNDGIYYFTEGTIKGVAYAAKTAIDQYIKTPTNMWNSCQTTIDEKKLAAIMLMLPSHELNDGQHRSRAPSPMTLSRWDNLNWQMQTHTYMENGEVKKKTRSLNERLFSHMDTAGYLRAHWSPGVGLWQLDPWDITKQLNHAQRADIREGGLRVASYLLGEHCKLSADDAGIKKAIKMWSACDTPSENEKCYKTYIGDPDSIYQSVNLNIRSVDTASQVEGGIQQRTCRWKSSQLTMPCFLYDLEAAEGYPSDYEYIISKSADSSDSQQVKEDEIDWTASATPVPMAFLSFTDTLTNTRFAVWPREWPRSNSYQYWPSDTVSSDKTIYRSVIQNDVVRCSPGRDVSPESKDPRIAAMDCAEELYKPFGEKIENRSFMNGNTIVEGWYDDSVPFRDGGTAEDRHKLQVEHCDTFRFFGQSVVFCDWVGV